MNSVTSEAWKNDLPGQMACARQHSAEVISQRELADQTFAIRIGAQQLAELITPGQFFMIRPAAGTDPLLGRPFALYDTIVGEEGGPAALEFAYHVVGKQTALMSHWKAGERVELWGPLGNGFAAYTGQHLLCVGGGIGYTPFLAVARETLGLRRYGSEPNRYHGGRGRTDRRVTLCYGVQTKTARADLSDFESLGDVPILISTDDGTEGHRGFVSELVIQQLERGDVGRPDGVYCCGPEPMMQAVARICQARNVDCWLSLETPMACGFGACFSCVTKVRTGDGDWDYRRTCVEGPVFPANSLAID